MAPFDEICFSKVNEFLHPRRFVLFGGCKQQITSKTVKIFFEKYKQVVIVK